LSWCLPCQKAKTQSTYEYAERTLESCSSVCRSHVTILTVMQVSRFYEMCRRTVNNPDQLHPENPFKSLPNGGSKNLERTHGGVLFSSFLVTLIVLVRF
jgi:hypothetical protein